MLSPLEDGQEFSTPVAWHVQDGLEEGGWMWNMGLDSMLNVCSYTHVMIFSLSLSLSPPPPPPIPSNPLEGQGTVRDGEE